MLAIVQVSEVNQPVKQVDFNLNLQLLTDFTLLVVKVKDNERELAVVHQPLSTKGVNHFALQTEKLVDNYSSMGNFDGKDYASKPVGEIALSTIAFSDSDVFATVVLSITCSFTEKDLEPVDSYY